MEEASRYASTKWCFFENVQAFIAASLKTICILE